VPTCITKVEENAVIDSTYKAGARQVKVIAESLAAAIGAGIPITEPAGHMICDIGGGTTEIAVISLAGIVFSKSIRIAGDEMDIAIIEYLKKTYNLMIGERTAEEVKIRIGCAYPFPKLEQLSLRRDLITGLPNRSLSILKKFAMPLPIHWPLSSMPLNLV